MLHDPLCPGVCAPMSAVSLIFLNVVQDEESKVFSCQVGWTRLGEKFTRKYDLLIQATYTDFLKVLQHTKHSFTKQETGLRQFVWTFRQYLG